MPKRRVVCGVSDFDRLHPRRDDASVFLYAFDLLVLNGADIGGERLYDRRAKLHKLLARPDGIRFSEHFAGDRARRLDHACRLRCEGVVSKRRDAAYRSGRSKAWLKVKNPDSPGDATSVKKGPRPRGDSGAKVGCLGGLRPKAVLFHTTTRGRLSVWNPTFTRSSDATLPTSRTSSNRKKLPA